MTTLRFIALDSDIVRPLQDGAPDANGQIPERHISDGDGVPCRHCLTDVPKGEAYLILAHRPFPAPQPYAEQGPIFLHAERCPRHDPAAGVPDRYRGRQQLLLRGYGANDRIVYGTGQMIPGTALELAAKRLLERPDVAYLHLRSASNNCYQFRIERAS